MITEAHALVIGFGSILGVLLGLTWAADFGLGWKLLMTIGGTIWAVNSSLAVLL